MSSIDQRIVEMQFDNKQFENGVQTTMKTLDTLKQKLNFGKSAKGLDELTKAGKRFSLDGLAASVDKIASKFSFMGVMGVTAMQRISNAAITTGKNLVKSLTVDPVRSGLSEYETQIRSVQTILSNTRSKGTTLDQVNAALDELNAYADKTIYNFTEMTRNIGTFTAAGVDLDTSVAAIKGISNLAAVSGSTPQQAATAMYQLSQALASGTIRLMDWNSVVNAGMGGEVLQDALKETARVHGIEIDKMIEKEGSFRETLQNGWLTSEVMLETLQKFTGDLSKEQILAMGYTEEQAAAIIALGEDANDAATKVKTFSDLIDTTKEALGSGWAQSWEYIIGDFEAARTLWTDVSNALNDIIGESADARNSMLKAWNEAGGRADLIEGLTDIFGALWNIVTAVGDAMDDIFPPATVDTLLSISSGVKEFGDNLQRLFSIVGKGTSFTGEDITTTETVGGVDFFGDNLSKGKRDEAVKQLQQYLKDAGYDLGKSGVDGIFGPMTEAALKEFQESAGLVADGIYGEKTHNALMEVLGLGPKEITTVTKGTKTVNFFGDALQRLHNIAEGVFAVLHIVWQGIQFAGNIIGHVLTLLAPVGDAILAVAEGIAGCFVNLDKWLEESGVFGDWLESIKTFLAPVGEWFERVGQSIKNFFGFGEEVNESNGEIKTFSTLWKRIKQSVADLGIWDKLTAAWQGLKDAFAEISPVIQEYWNTAKTWLGDKFGDLLDWIVEKVPLAAEKIGEFFTKIVEWATPGIKKIPEIFGKIGNAFRGLFDSVDEDGNRVPGVLSKIGNFFTGLYERVKGSEQFQNIAAKVTGFLSSAWEKIKAVFADISTWVTGLFSGEGAGEGEKAGESIQKSVEPVVTVFDWLKEAWTGKIFPALQSIYDWLSKFAGNVGPGGLLMMFVGILGGVKAFKFISSIIGAVSSFGSLTKSLSDLAGTASAALKNIIKGRESILGIALAIGIIVAAIYVLGTMDVEVFKRGAITLAGIMAALLIFSKLSAAINKGDSIDKFKDAGAGMRKMAMALLMMAGSVKMLGTMSLGELAKGIGGLIALILALKLMMNSVSKSGGNVQVKGFFSLALALGVLVGVMKLINTFTIEEYVGGLIGLIGLMATLRIFIGAMKKVSGSSVQVKGFFSLGLALGVLVGVMKLINTMTISEYAGGLIGLIGLMVTLRIFMGAMKKTGEMKFGSTAGLIALSIAIGLLAGVMVLIGQVGWDTLAKGLLGIIGVCAALALVTKTMGKMDIKSGVASLIQCIGLVAVIGSFGMALSQIKTVNTDKIIAFTGGLSAVLLSFGAFTKLAGSVGIAGVGTSLLAILGLVAVIGLVIAALAGLSKIPGFQDFMNSGAASIGEMIGSFTGSMQAASMNAMSKGLSKLADTEIDEEGLNHVLEMAGLIQEFSANLPEKGFGKQAADKIFGSELDQFSWDMVSFGTGFSIFAAMINAVTITEDLSAKTASAIAIANQILAFAQGIPAKTPAKTVVDSLFGSELDQFSSDMVAFGEGFTNFAAMINAVTITEDLSSKTAFAISIANQILAFSEGLPEKTPAETIVDWLFGSEIEQFSSDMVAFGEGFSAFATEMAKVTIAEDLSAKTASAIAIANQILTFSEGLPDKTPAETIVDWLFGSELQQFTGDMVSFGEGFSAFAAEMAKVTIAEDLSAKTASAISIANQIQAFSEGLPEDTPGEALTNWLFGTAMENFTGDMTAFSTGFNNFATQMNAIKEIEGLDSKVTYAIGIANAIQALNDGLEGTYTDAERFLSFMDIFGSKEVTDMELFTGDMNTFATNFNKFTAAMEDVETSTELSAKVTDAIAIADEVARFLESLATMNIEANKGEIEKWLSGDTKQNTLFENIEKLATSMSGLVTAFPGISEEGNTVREDVEEVVGIIESIARLITNISDPNQYVLDGTAFSSTSQTTLNTFNVLLEYITSLSQTIDAFLLNVEGFDLERFQGFLNPVNGFVDALLSINTGETDGSMDGLNSLLGDFTTTISGFLEGLNVEEINTKAAELDSAIQNIRNILSGGVETGEEGATGSGLLGGMSAEDVSSTISSFAASLGSNASTLASVGSELGSAVSSGMGMNVDTSGVDSLCSSLVYLIRSYRSNFYTAGYYLSQGVANGISGGGGIVKSAARSIISNALAAMRDEADEASPSKETERIARFMDMGLVNGFKGYSKVVNRAAEGVAGGALDTTRNTLANLSTVLSEDMDTTPVIRPVMDMSDVSAGARTINGIFSSGRTLSVGVTAAKAQAASASMRESKRRQNGTDGGGSNVSNSNDSSVNLTGNNFYVRSDQDVRALASEIAALTRQQQRSYGAAF